MGFLVFKENKSGSNPKAGMNEYASIRALAMRKSFHRQNLQPTTEAEGETLLESIHFEYRSEQESNDAAVEMGLS